MRRKDREIFGDEITEIINKAVYGVLSTTGADGAPYAVPITYVYDGSRIYLHCAGGVGMKLENIRRDNRVCFTIVGDTEVAPASFGIYYESVVVKGHAAEVDGDEKRSALELWIDKYSSDYRESGHKYIDAALSKVGIIAITPDEITGKARRKS